MRLSALISLNISGFLPIKRLTEAAGFISKVRRLHQERSRFTSIMCTMALTVDFVATFYRLVISSFHMHPCWSGSCYAGMLDNII